MRVALGLKAHSGWAVLVAIGEEGSRVVVVDRRRLDLIEDHDHEWAGQPYHAAEGKPPRQANAIVDEGIAAARRSSIRELKAAMAQLRSAGHSIAVCAVLTAQPMPDWDTAQILAVHFRMHKAEGVLYPEALMRAAKECRLRSIGIAEKELEETANATLGALSGAVSKQLAAMGKVIGAPWRADHKKAALAAIIALRNC